MRRAAALAILVLLAAATACGKGGAPRPPALAELPDLELNDLNGDPVRLAAGVGEVRLVNFWATWCAPCREEIPVFNELEASYGSKGFRIIAIAMDDEGVSVVKPFAEKMGINYLTLIGTEAVADVFRVPGYPTSVLVNREGKLVKTWTGLIPKSILVKEIEALLAS